MTVAENLAELQDDIKRIAFARIDATGRPVPSWIALLETIDAILDRWERPGERSNDDHYRLGLLLGILGYMTACRLDATGELVPQDVALPEGNATAEAVRQLRKSVLAFTAPADA